MKEVFHSIIEDSGSEKNWISRAQIERFGLSPKRGAVITGMTLTGEQFVSDTYVELSWKGKGSNRGKDRFYVAPEKTPIDMLVGHEFMNKYPERQRVDKESTWQSQELVKITLLRRGFLE